jgi:cell division transport system permease protein
MTREYRGLDEPEVPSNTATYFFKEALRRIWVSKRTSFVAVSMIAISLLILGIFMLVAENLEHAVTQWQGKSRINVYFEGGASPEQIRAVDQYLSSRGELSRRKFVTADEALRRFRTLFSGVSDLVTQLEENPFPPSYEVEVSPSFVQSSAFEPAIDGLRRLPGIEQVQYDWEWLARLRRIAGIVNFAGLVAGGVLGVAAAFTIANVIRLTMMLYREEIGIMRLVGATERIIRGPFLVEGILQGTIGGILAVVLLLALFYGGRQAVGPSSSLLLGFLFGVFLPWQKIALLIAGGMFAGWFGSWLSVRERVGEE